MKYIGVWAALLPEVKSLHSISNAVLGGILVGAIAGAILCLPVTAYSISKIGSAKSTSLGSLVLNILFPIVGIKGPLWILVVGVICLGFGIAWVDVSINAQAVLLEKYLKTPKLGLCHSVYAIGGLIGALAGGGLATSNLSLLTDIGLISAIGTLPTLFCYFGLINFDKENAINAGSTLSSEGTDTLTTKLISSDNPIVLNGNVVENNDNISEIHVSSNKEKVKSSMTLIIGLCILGGLAYFGEGSIGDWSAIYLEDTLNASPLVSSFGFALFQLFVAIGRYSSDKVVDRISRYRLLQLSGIITCVGMTVVVLAPSLGPTSTYIAIIGFGITGMGISVVAPLVISIAGSSIHDMSPSDAIATVSSLTYVGVLIGPPLIGGLSGALGQLRYALIVDGAILTLITIVSTILGKSLDKTSHESEGNIESEDVDVVA